ncbi:MAG: hypothetical protein RL226_682 [Bacteroidota bacterium]
MSTLLFGILHAQIPQAINYQGAMRDVSGVVLAFQEVELRIGILQNNTSGPLVWEELHNFTTDDLGLFNVQIGQGLSTGNGLASVFSSVNWASGTYFLKVEADTGGGFELLGTSQLVSVPYALFAESAGDVDDADADPDNERISDFSFEGTTLTITEDGTNFDLDLEPMLTEALVGESINLVQLVGTDLNIVEGDDVFITDLSPLLDDDWTIEEDVIYNDTRDVGIGTATPESTLDINGSLSLATTTLVGPQNAVLNNSHNVVLANVSGGEVIITLPDASLTNGRVYTIKRFGNLPLSSNVQLLAQNGQQIEGAASRTLSGFQGQVTVLISDGNNWWVLSEQTIN